MAIGEENLADSLLEDMVVGAPDGIGIGALTQAHLHFTLPTTESSDIRVKPLLHL